MIYFIGLIANIVSEIPRNIACILFAWSLVIDYNI